MNKCQIEFKCFCVSKKQFKECQFSKIKFGKISCMYDDAGCCLNLKAQIDILNKELNNKQNDDK
jgi:hypothetical protein